MPKPAKNIDLTRFIAIGDSVTAGYRDGAMFYEGQTTSFSCLLAGQFGCEFKQPLVSPDSVGIGFFENSRLIVNKAMDDSVWISYLAQHGDFSVTLENCYASQGPFNNLGVPGAKAITVIAPSYGNNQNEPGNYNPFFFRMASDPGSASILSDALAIQPTFFSLFIGNNDVLAYALSGGTSDAITPVEGAPGVGFKESLNHIVKELMANGARGVISNLPCLTSLPFFNTIQYNDLLLDDSEKELMSSKFGSLFNFKKGLNSFVIEDSTIDGGLRQIEKGEFISVDILLDKNKSEYLKGLKAIPKKYYLSKEQIRVCQQKLNAYNDIIKETAAANGLAFVDTDCLLKTMKPDRVYIPQSQTLKFRTGGVFSLDGLHINKLGHAILANEFIRSINQTYHTTIDKINLTKFRGESV